MLLIHLHLKELREMRIGGRRGEGEEGGGGRREGEEAVGGGGREGGGQGG